MGNAFTWFPSFTETLEIVPDDVRADFVWAIIQYGTNGIEPDFDNWELSALFASLRGDIDNSVANRSKNKGGRPQKKSKEVLPEVSARGSENEKPRFSNEETPVSENENGGSEGTKPKPNQTNINQSNPNQINKRFVPPSVSEVQAYIAEKGYHFDAEAFVAHYESNGWKVGRNSMKSWKASCATWEKRRQDYSGGKGTARHVEYD